MHKNTKWAKEILENRNEEGMWGNFHSLSFPTNYKKVTTEQAIRRLRILGFTKDDEPIRTVIDRMLLCITGKRNIDDYYEKKHDWVFFQKLMLSAWVRIFDPKNEIAFDVAKQWANVIENAFKSGQYNLDDDINGFTLQFGRKPESAFETGFDTFYHVMLVQGLLTPKTESSLLDHYISKPDGIYYVYNKPLNILPEDFASKKASHYLGAIEILSHYEQASEKLQFVLDWLESNNNKNGKWDIGNSANDKVYFPLSDSWPKDETREDDCTERITNLVNRLKV